MPSKYFEFLPSKTLEYWMMSIHVLVFLVILLLPLDYRVKIIFLSLIVLSYALHRFHLATYLDIQALEYNENNVWKLYTHQGEIIPATLLKRNYISDFLLILRFEFMEPSSPPSRGSIFQRPSIILRNMDPRDSGDDAVMQKNLGYVESILLFSHQLTPQQWRQLQMIVRS